MKRSTNSQPTHQEFCGIKSTNNTCDVLMIAHNRPEYLALSLPALLASGDNSLRVWVWQNGTNETISKIIDSYRNHERMHKVHHSSDNVKLTEPTNWLWGESDATYVGKVDDDTLVPNGWLQSLTSAHEKVSRFGVLGSWVLPIDDYDEKLAKGKMARYGGQLILEKPSMAGSGYLMKRACIQQEGLLQDDDTFPAYCMRLAWLGWINGWHLPLIVAEHMDDPRSTFCILKTEEDFQRLKPLTAVKNNVRTLEQWKEFNSKAAPGLLRSPRKAGRLFWIRSLMLRVAKRCGSFGAHVPN